MTGVEGVAVVQLENVAVALFLESQDHQHDLIREMQLVALGSGGSGDRASRLAASIEGVLTTYSPVRHSTRAQALAARDRGDDRVTLDVPVQDGIGDALHHWLELLETADELCRNGELLLIATRPEIAQFRRWYVEQITARLAAPPARAADADSAGTGV